MHRGRWCGGRGLDQPGSARCPGRPCPLTGRPATPRDPYTEPSTARHMTSHRGRHPALQATSVRQALGAALLAGALLAPSGGQLAAQERGTPFGEWRYWGADLWSTRFSPVGEVHAGNFEDLEVAWIWRGDNFGPSVDYAMRSTPIYAGGRLFTVAGRRRAVAAVDPATGETLWTFREPHTRRWELSPRQNYGRGVAYHELDGRGVVYVVTPAFFLHALDAETGRPLEGFGRPVPVAGFSPHGTVDMLADLGHQYDPYEGILETVGGITTSSPPIVVDDVIIVGSSAAIGIRETRIENVPGDILAYDARTGEHLWKFRVIPAPGEFGHETWEGDAWSYSGNINAWAPLSADPELGMVYIPTDAPTNDLYGGFRPGDNLFGTSILALDVRTGRRVWHFQTVRHDIWDYDNPVAPILLDLEVDGRRVPTVLQATKQNFAFTFDRRTGEPIWPIEERPVPPSSVPGERASPTQPFPTRPAAWDIQGLTEEDLIDFTPELRRMAVQTMDQFQIGPLYLPPLHRDNDLGKRGSVICPSVTGGTNVIGGPVADPETGIMYVASVRACSGVALVPGSELDDGGPGRAGATVVGFAGGAGISLGGPEGLPILKPPYGRITAIDMNTGEHLWWIPNGDTPDRIRNHPRLAGLDIGNTGQPSHANALVTRTLLMYGEGRGGRPLFHAVDKRTGTLIGTLELPAPSSASPMTFLHEGRQYIVVPVAGSAVPGSLVALRVR
jgi:glucose dehydrogenase